MSKEQSTGAQHGVGWLLILKRVNPFSIGEKINYMEGKVKSNTCTVTSVQLISQTLLINALDQSPLKNLIVA